MGDFKEKTLPYKKKWETVLFLLAFSFRMGYNRENDIEALTEDASAFFGRAQRAPVR